MMDGATLSLLTNGKITSMAQLIKIWMLMQASALILDYDPDWQGFEGENMDKIRQRRPRMKVDRGCCVGNYCKHGCAAAALARLNHFIVRLRGEEDRIQDKYYPLRIWAKMLMARSYAGTVMLEGASLSEGRGTTRPLELFGAPDIDARAVMNVMRELAPEWLEGCALREIWFEPTFHKHAGRLCHGVHIHPEGGFYDHDAFRPWRLQALAFKAIRRLYPDYALWRGEDFKYEYTEGHLAIDIINGGPDLREWVDNAQATPNDLDAMVQGDETSWRKDRERFLLY